MTGRDTVHVWSIRSDLPASVVTEMETILDSDERRRAGAMVFDEDRHRFIAVHGAVRIVVGQWLDAPPEQIRWSQGRYGKPELTGAWTGVQVNLSCSDDLALLAITVHRPVGVDVQTCPTESDATRLATRFFPAAEAQFVAAGDPDEQADRFATLWTRKEACVKAAGGRLVQGLPVPVHGPGHGIVVRLAEDDYLVRDLPVQPGFRAAVALAGRSEFDVVHHSWSR